MANIGRILAALVVSALLLFPSSAALAGPAILRELIAQNIGVADIQQRLNELGFDAGTPDGIAGERSRRAMMSFQAANGLPVTGMVSNRDMEVLFGSGAVGNSPATQVAGRRHEGFEILENYDLPEGDYTRINDASLATCERQCQADGRCQGFTFNTKYKVCFLKDSLARPLVFGGAISGRKTTGQTTSAGPIGASTDGILVGAPRGCAAQEAVVSRVRETLAVNVTQSTGRVGSAEGVAVNWRIGAFPERMPVFLILSVAQSARFGGKGLYGLTPGAAAPFDFKQFKGTTRAVIPLFGRGALSGGDVRVDALAEGGLDLSWDIVGMTDCGERAAPQPRTASLSVTPGAPIIIFQNPFSSAAPKERLLSPANDRTLEVFDGYYRLFDEDGYLLTEQAGRLPRFSPTGRYVAAWVAALTLQIIDTIDGKPVLTLPAVAEGLAWDNADSFAVVPYAAWGRTLVVSPLLGEEAYQTVVGERCHACGGLGESLAIDLANNLAITSDAASSLTSDFRYITDFVRKQDPAEMLPAARAYSQTTLLAPPIDRGDQSFDWQLGTEKPLSHTTGIYFFQEPDPAPTAWLQAYEFPRLEVASAETAVVGGDGARPEIRARAVAGLPTITTGAGPSGVLAALNDWKFMDGANLEPRQTDLEVITPENRNTFVGALYRLPGGLDITIQDTMVCGGDPVEKSVADVSLKTYGAIETYTTERFIIGTSGCAEGSGNFMNSNMFLVDKSLPGQAFDLQAGLTHEDVSNDRCQALLGNCGVTIKVFAERFVAFWSTSSGALAIYDGQEKRLVASYAALPRISMVRDVFIDETGHWLLLYFAGDLFTILDLTKNQSPGERGVVSYEHAADPVALQGMLADGELVVWNRGLRFLATSEGAEFVSVRYPGRSSVYALTQFDSVLRDPELIPAVMSHAAAGTPIDLPPPPVIADVALDAGGDGALVVNVAWTGGELREVSLLQDGQLTAVTDVTSLDGRLAFKSSRLQGAKWATVLVQDQTGLVSLPRSVAMETDQRGPRKVRLLAVGVDRYDDPKLPTLPLSKADAGNMWRIISSEVIGAEVTDTQLAVDADTTAAAIRMRLALVARAAQPDETVVLSFSGHGIQDAEGKLYLATRDTTLANIEQTAIAWTEIAAAVSRVPGRVIVFLDTCHSGIAGTEFAAPSEGAVSDFLTAIPSNVVIFSASKGRQTSEEQSAIGGGVFTTALVSALLEDRAKVDTNGSGSFEISELYRYLRQEVIRLTQGRQTPWFARNKMAGDFAVF